ncbi:tRNA lysidine(34) synthetase TilS [Methylobacillus caricis]|uniref:tRNA lysidine(34) synthetase TilS n=1 Tax=Methylobacillus caricis TaxID=1971611 RepID=UPI001CFFDD53|nr:tRNA lysidine(34) synthetase TilS [Methylobacillus caricis]MCB5187724.1 tRNA lysidine(34) synthetase TilS [Methylobacillus caricis]
MALAETTPSAGINPDVLRNHLSGFLSAHIQAGQTLLAAFSGGLDSRVLLELLAEARKKHNFILQAMYVHHGLSYNADAWAGFCQQVCERLGVLFTCCRVDVDQDSGKGIEAAAREARYQALFSSSADHIMLAHHQDDQAETLLLQLLRGAGSKGLAAMAMQDAERRLLRPLLDVARADLLSFARQLDLQWIEDESNLDLSYDRNYCRHQLLPYMEQRFPAVKRTFARSAVHLAEAADLLDDLAQIDAKQALVNNQLDIAVLAQLSSPRSRNLLRWWLSLNQLPLPSATRIQEMLQQLLVARPGSQLKVLVAGNAWLRRYQGWACIEIAGQVNDAIALQWQGEEELVLPNNGRLLFSRQMGRGLALERLATKTLTVRHRSGGERFKPDAHRPTRTLRHLYQESRVPPWQRECLPLLYSGDQLLIVPGIGVACEFQAMKNEMGLVVEWEPLA